MNKEWSDLNEIMQWQIKKRDNYSLGIETLIELRKLLMEQMLQFKNELVKEQIGEFSKQLNIDELYQYITDVAEATTSIILSLKFEDMKTKIVDKKRRKLQDLNVVSEDENAYWLIDYWCGKDIRGLIQMPLSRHWIMHLEACLRIRSKLG